MYLDVDVLLALIKERDFHKPYAERILAFNEDKYTSVISLLELEIVIKREMSDILSMDILSHTLKIIPSLKIISCDQKIFDQSLALRRNYSLGIFDSVHAATALACDKRIASTDNAYKRIHSLTLVV